MYTTNTLYLGVLFNIFPHPCTYVLYLRSTYVFIYYTIVINIYTDMYMYYTIS